MTRFKAFAIHLGISTIIFLILLYLIIFVWYPHPYFAVDGGWEGIRIITGVDMVLGPLLTLIVFRPGKKGLRLDLAFIGVVQVAALAWGIWIVHDQRTALVVHTHDRFVSINSEQIEHIGHKAQAMLKSAVRTPLLAYVRLPTDPKQFRIFLNHSIRKTIPLFNYGDLYEPVGPENMPQIAATSLPLEDYSKRSAEHRARWQALIDRHGGTDADYVLVPLQCRYDTVVLVLRRSDGKPVDSLRR